MKEETGLVLTSWKFRGIVTFCYKDDPAEYMCLYTADKYEGTLTSCAEGVLEWVEKNRVKELELWKGDLLFFDLMEKDVPFFSMKLCYHEDGTLYQALLDGKEMEIPD